MKKFNIVFVVAFLIFIPIQTYSQFTYEDFSSTSGLNLIVNAAQFENKLRLASDIQGQKGAAWYTTKQYIQEGFECTFQFQLTPNGASGGDGFAFVIQNFSDMAISASTGGSLGYHEIENSLAIEFDIYHNFPHNDPNGNHISIHTRGLLPNSVNHTYSIGSTTNIPVLENGNIYTSKISYWDNVLQVFLEDLSNPILSVVINISDTLDLDNGKSWVGFTAATGLFVQNHDLISWSFRPLQDLNIDLSSPYTQDSQFYERTPQTLNKFLFNVRITGPTLPNLPLDSIVISATLDENPLTLQLNTSLVTLDSDGNGIIDHLPAIQTPTLDYIEFIASSDEYSDNQTGKNLQVIISGINSQPFYLDVSDVVSLRFAKQGGNTFSLLRDAYSFGNIYKLKWYEIYLLMLKHGIDKGGWIYAVLDNFIKRSGGRCYGISTTSGSYFLYPDLKPWPGGDTYEWSIYNPFVSEKINLAHISQTLYSIQTNVSETYESLISNLEIQRPTIFGIRGELIADPGKTGSHSVLALGMTTFNNLENTYISLYDPNFPASCYSAILNYGNDEFYYKSSGYIFDEVGAFPDNSLTNWESLEYYYNRWLKELNASIYQSETKIFAIACPANLLVNNSTGLRVGYLANGTFINEIPGATVNRAPTNDAPDDSLTVINVPLNDEYQVEMSSFGSGNLVFEHLEPVDSTILFTTASDTIPITSQTICHFDEADSTHLYVDFDGDGAIDSTINLYYSLLNLPLPAQAGVEINEGWNLISNPVTREENTDSVLHLFPNSVYPYVFRYTPGIGYQQDSTLENGPGFWGNFPSSEINPIEGGLIEIDTIQVVAGWNLVGSISVSIDTSTVISLPEGIRASNWFGFSGGYNISNLIKPGFAYWVKTNAAGEFVFSVAEQLNKSQYEKENVLDKFNTITITDESGNTQTLYFGVDANEEITQSFFEMPPLPPSGLFDARFRTEEGDYILQPHTGEENSVVEFPIVIQSTSNSLSISWEIKNGMSYELSDGLEGKFFTPRVLTNQGTIQVRKTNNIILKVSDEAQLPTKFELAQNYPNPFNPSTKIKFSVAKEVQVNLSIYNILGERVREIKNETMKPGYYEVEFDATSFASGIYFYRIKAGDFVVTKKMVLLK